MTDTTSPPVEKPQKRSLLQQLDLDMRLLGMIGAFVLLCIGFSIFTDGRFLSPRNLFNLTIQTVSVAIMATGMVFVIVMRHIDLSVGSVLAVCSAIMALIQTRFLPEVLGLGFDNPMTWIVAILAGLSVGALIGAFQGWLVGYQGVPAFIVTLGGFLIWRNYGWLFTSGQTIGPLDHNFLKLGGVNGTMGESISWAIGILAVAATAWIILTARKGRTRHGFPAKPVWAEAIVIGLMSVAILGFVWILNSYDIPQRKLQRMFEARGEVMPDGLEVGYGLPISVLILIATAIVMTIVARRTRLGRYIFATGGNPDAAELSGINTRLLTVKVFSIMGFLCALSAVVASARLQNHTNDIGTLDELRVIAAAVIGGTALAGGAGTIYGAILGALVMQSLQSGMAMVGVDAPIQNIVVGSVLVFAVWLDIQYRKRLGAK